MGLAISEARRDGDSVGVRCEDGLIAEIGAGVEPRPDDELIDAGGMALVAPFINGHTHAAMTLFRGFGDDLPLMEWLEGHIWPAERRLEPSDVYWGTRLAAVEMIRSGTARFADMYWHAPQVARAVEDSGMRALVSAVLLDGMEMPGGGGLREAAVANLDELAVAGPRVQGCLGPHAIYTVGRESLEWLAGVADERGVPVQIHLSETEQEVHDCLEAHGSRPAAYLDELGLLGPRTILAHGVWLDRAELELVAERGATVVTNPAANMKLAVGGAFPYPQAAAAGVALGLGTDGVSSNNNLDMLEEVKLLALLQKHAAADPSVLPASEALDVARGRRSPLLGGRPLEVGEPADMLLLRTDAPELSAGDLDAGLAYAASGSAVDTTIVAGRALMRGGVVEGAEEAIAEVRERAARLTR
jgi:5-methylthioadenosine/S-adenosylhomocysteine deaminase